MLVLFFHRQCGLLMVAETVSLGVLSLPAAVAGLGLVPYVDPSRRASDHCANHQIVRSSS